MKFKPKLVGKIKTWQTRLASYVSMVNFGMLLYLFVVENKWLSWYQWVTIMFVAVVVTVFVDIKVIMPSSSAYQFSKNPPLVEMKEDIEMIKEMLIVEKNK